MKPSMNCPPSLSQTPFAKSIPKLTLTKFDGDPLKWTDWEGMFRAIIHQSEMSLSEKMMHLQQNVVGKAKAAIAGFRYNGNLYHQALKRLEDRFGRPHVVVQAHLDKLAKLPAMLLVFPPIPPPSATSCGHSKTSATLMI